VREKIPDPVLRGAKGRGIDAPALTAALASFNGSRRELAERLGLSERTLYRRLNKCRGGGETT